MGVRSSCCAIARPSLAIHSTPSLSAPQGRVTFPHPPFHPEPRVFYTFRLEARSSPPPGSPFPPPPLDELAALVLQLAAAPTTACYGLTYGTDIVAPGQLGRSFDQAVYFVPDPDVRPYGPGTFPDTGLPVSARLGKRGWWLRFAHG